jgi:hypothetical protein
VIRTPDGELQLSDQQLSQAWECMSNPLAKQPRWLSRHPNEMLDLLSDLLDDELKLKSQSVLH